MEGYPRNGTKEEMLAWLRIHAANGTLHYKWEDSIPRQLLYHYRVNNMLLDNQPVKYLKSIEYIPELDIYTSKEELLSTIDFRKVTKYSYKLIKNIPDEVLIRFFGHLPPYYGDINPILIESLEEFDFNILKPSFLEPSFPKIPSNFRRYPNPTDEEIQAKIDKILIEINRDRDLFLSLVNEIQRNPNIFDKIQSLTKIIELKFKLYGPFPGVDLVKAMKNEKRKINYDTHYRVHFSGAYSSFLEKKVTVGMMNGYKQPYRLNSDSISLKFIRAVGGLILYLLTRIPSEDYLEIKNSEIIFNLLRTYIYNFGFSTYDMIPMQNHLEIIRDIVNRHTNYEYIVIDCEDKNTERCARALLLVPTETRSRIIITNVNDNAEVTIENQIRLINKYSLDLMSGGKRVKTYKRKKNTKLVKKTRKQK